MIGKNVEFAAELLALGKTVAIPTETVYGLATNALDEEAVAEVFKIKNRPTFDPLIVHLDDFGKAELYAKSIPDEFKALAEAYSPGPITFLLPKNEIIPYIVTSGLKEVAIRIPNHPMALELLQSIPFPLAAPSANPFGFISPTSAEHVYKTLGRKIPYILDGGTCSVGIESTIIGMENNQFTVFRKGGISVEQIERVLNEKVHVKEGSTKTLKAPGMLESHYAPKKPIFVGNIEELAEQHKKERLGIISFKKEYIQGFNLILSKKGNLEEASYHLFSYMHQMDESGADIILSEYVPEEGLGRAINDRLRRAAAKSGYVNT